MVPGDSVGRVGDGGQGDRARGKSKKAEGKIEGGRVPGVALKCLLRGRK